MRCLGRCHREDGKAHDELAPLPGPGARNRDRPAMQLDQTSHERQSDPEPAPRTIQRMVRLHEEIEDVFLHLGRDADPGVSHSQHGLVALSRQRERDLAAGLGVLRGVVQQVRDDLLQAGRVAFDRGRLGREGLESSCRDASNKGRAASTACVDDRVQVDDLLAELDLPRVIRETSKRSSSRRVMCWIWRLGDIERLFHGTGFPCPACG